MTSGWSSARRLRFWLLLRVGLAGLLAILLNAAQGAAQEPQKSPEQSIRIEVNRVNVGVIVTDGKGNFVENLRREQFQILDGGSVQPITDFSPVDAPAQVLLLLEAGPAVYLLQDSHLFVANALLQGLSAGDRVAIAVYNQAPTAVLDYTADKAMAEAALDQIQFNLGYGDLNLAKSLNTVLDWLDKVPGKKSIVLVSSGVDTSSPAVSQALLSRLETGDVRILAVSMSGPLRNGKRGSKQQIQQTEEAFAQADAWLKTLAEATGGRAFFPENAKAFQQTYQQIASLVRHEYSLAFVPPVADGAVHRIEVKVVDPTEQGSASEYRVNHRRGYIAPKAGR